MYGIDHKKSQPEIHVALRRAAEIRKGIASLADAKLNQVIK